MSGETDSAGEHTPSFGDALEELEAILQRIDGDETDIDRLGDELRRATTLLDVCRGKIRKAEAEVSQILDKLAEPDGTPP